MRATRLSAGRHAGVDNGQIASPAFDDPAVTQLTLPGFEATPQLPAHRLFLAIKPDVDTAERIARLIQQLRPVVGFKGKALRAERLHVTLHHLGDFVHLPPDDVVARVRAAAAGLALPAFDATFNQVVSFHGRRDHRPFVLLGDEGVGRLMAFQAALGEALEHAAVPVRFLPSPSLVGDSLYEALAQRGFLPRRAVQRMRARAASPEDAQHLRCEAGAPILTTERRCFLADGEIVEYCETRYKGEVYDFVFELQR